MRHLISLVDLSQAEVAEILEISADLKTKLNAGTRQPLFPGYQMALLFEKQSLRTRVSFQTLMTHLGGGSMMLGADAGFGKRESIADFTKVLSEMVDLIVVRAKSHKTVEEVAKFSSVPVINGLTDQSHPCQALADILTLKECAGTLFEKTFVWVGDGNNVAKSLARVCAHTGVTFVCCTPVGYEFEREFVTKLMQEFPELELVETNDPQAAVKNASAIYTDVWASMGQEAEQEQRKKDFADYQVNSDLMAVAPSDAIFMHCLPARRGEEVTDAVMDGPQSKIVQQAANRLHAQKGVVTWLLRQNIKN